MCNLSANPFAAAQLINRDTFQDIVTGNVHIKHKIGEYAIIVIHFLAVLLVPNCTKIFRFSHNGKKNEGKEASSSVAEMQC